ncbi:MAG: hypothetical protein FJ125_05465 [Deltaproteobacteria bacterium]|nr:hypothetical protein [Deltaproteobacteria bacterium]
MRCQTQRWMVLLAVLPASLPTIIPAPAAAQDAGLALTELRPSGTGGTPRLAWDKPVVCLQDEQGRRLRLQCNLEAPGGPTCLVAPDERSDGGPLQRVQPCQLQGQESYDKLLDPATRKLVQAVAEAPPGWHRDEQGRVFQVSFDLRKRFWLGAGWEPAIDPEQNRWEPGRVRFDMGFVASWLNPRRRTRHTLKLVEGELALGDLESRATLLAYDTNHLSITPKLRLTTFFGEPRRHDIYANIGFGLRLLQVRARSHRLADTLDLEIGEIHTAWDIFQSRDLSNHLRLELGASTGTMWSELGAGDEDLYVAPGAALVGLFGIDDDGFHNLSFAVHATVPWWMSGANEGKISRRGSASLSYELILLAVNDQPLTLLLSGRADYRDDLGPAAEPWEAALLVGLRLSFWAPAKVFEKLDVQVRG